jgi:hypothetical protein
MTYRNICVNDRIRHVSPPSISGNGRLVRRAALLLGVAAFGLLLNPGRGEAALQVVACISTATLSISDDPRGCPGGRVVNSLAGLWSVTAPPSGASTAAVQLMKKFDGDSPRLFFDALSQRAFPVALIVSFDDRGGRVFSMLLTNVRIASIVTARSDQPDGIPVETVSFAFTQLETASMSTSMCWDFAQNRAC